MEDSEVAAELLIKQLYRLLLSKNGYDKNQKLENNNSLEKLVKVSRGAKYIHSYQ